jgi:hypothetical protein
MRGRHICSVRQVPGTLSHLWLILARRPPFTWAAKRPAQPEGGKAQKRCCARQWTGVGNRVGVTAESHQSSRRGRHPEQKRLSPGCFGGRDCLRVIERLVNVVRAGFPGVCVVSSLVFWSRQPPRTLFRMIEERDDPGMEIAQPSAQAPRANVR